MTNPTTVSGSTVTTPAPAQSFLQWLEGDVIAVCQKIEAGLEVVAEDITGGLTWLGSHLGVIASTISAVQAVEAQFNSAGLEVPAVLANGIQAINNAVTGVNQALSGQSVSANAGAALNAGYQAVKVLQIAASGAAQISATLTAVATAEASPTVTGSGNE